MHVPGSRDSNVFVVRHSIIIWFRSNLMEWLTATSHCRRLQIVRKNDEERTLHIYVGHHRIIHRLWWWWLWSPIYHHFSMCSFIFLFIIIIMQSVINWETLSWVELIKISKWIYTMPLTPRVLGMTIAGCEWELILNFWAVLLDSSLMASICSFCCSNKHVYVFIHLCSVDA